MLLETLSHIWGKLMKACLQLNYNSVPEKINLLQLIQQNEQPA